MCIRDRDKEAGKFDFNWGVTTIPHPEGVEAGATVGSTTPVAINAKSDDPDLAWEFVKFATGEAVSYTHLDVYKRQIPTQRRSILQMARNAAIWEKILPMIRFPTVSYTHLMEK